MNNEMAYLLGLILGNGELQRGIDSTNITIDFPYKNLYTDDQKDVEVYVKASLLDIKDGIEPLIGTHFTVSRFSRSLKLSFKISNEGYVAREILRLIGNGTHHSSMRMSSELFNITKEELKILESYIATKGKTPNIVTTKICKESGLRATDKCTNTYSEIFIKGKLPKTCDAHDNQYTVCSESGL